MAMKSGACSVISRRTVWRISPRIAAKPAASNAPACTIFSDHIVVQTIRSTSAGVMRKKSSSDRSAELGRIQPMRPFQQSLCRAAHRASPPVLTIPR